MPQRETTLTEFIIGEQRRFPGATGGFTALLNDIRLACKRIAYAVGKGALAGVHGSAGRATRRARSRRSSTCWRTRSSCAPTNGAGTSRPWPPRSWSSRTDSGRISARALPARVRSAGRILQHRRQRRGRLDLLGARLPPAPPTSTSTCRWARSSRCCAAREGVARADERATSCSPARDRCAPATRSTARPPCWCSPSAAACTASRSTARSASSSSPIQTCACPRTPASSPSTPRTAASGSRRSSATSRSASPARPARAARTSTCAGSPRWWPRRTASCMRGGVFLYPRDSARPGKPRPAAAALRGEPDRHGDRAGGRPREHRATRRCSRSSPTGLHQRIGLRVRRRGTRSSASSSTTATSTRQPYDAPLFGTRGLFRAARRERPARSDMSEQAIRSSPSPAPRAPAPPR